MVEQSKVPRTLTAKNIQKGAEIVREGAVLKVVWKLKFSEPAFAIRIFRQVVLW